MRILLINQPFHPDVVATAQHMADWSQHLVSQGHTVTVIASRSVYGSQGAMLARRESYRGVDIYRVGANLFKKGRILTRLVDFGLFHVLALRRALLLPRQDVVVCLTTPPFIGVVGMLMKNLKGSRYVQYEMDLYPDVPVALGVMKRGSAVERVFEGIHRKLLGSADRVIVLGRCMEGVIRSKGVAAGKLVRVTPWADPVEAAPAARDANAFRVEHKLHGRTVVMYSGNLGLGHDLDTLVEAMVQLNESGADADRALQFVFIGGGRRMADLERAAAARGLKNFLLLGYQPRDRLAETLSAADVHLITQAVGTSGMLVPSKYYGILAAGKPAIYIGPPTSEVARSMVENQVGAVIAPGDARGLVEALRHFADPGAAAEVEALRARALALLAEEHSRQINTARLTRMVEALVQGKRWL